MILPIFLYPCVNLFLVLSEVYRLTVLENSALRKVLMPTKEEMKCSWRKIAYRRASPFLLFATQYHVYEIMGNETGRGVCGGED